MQRSSKTRLSVNFTSAPCCISVVNSRERAVRICQLSTFKPNIFQLEALEGNL